MLEKIRAIPEGPKVRAIVVSSESSADLKERAKLAGVLAWIIKLPQPQDLRAPVHQILTRN